MSFSGLYAGSAFYLAQMALIGVLWLGGNMVISGSMSVGSLTSFAMYAVNLGYSVSNLSNAYGGLTKGQGAGTRIFEILDRAPLSRPVEGARKRPESFDTTISFQDVTFAYPTRKQSPVLRGLSFDVRAGEVLGVAGSSGSGKSTIVYLLSRLYDPISGEIRIGGIDVADLDSQWLHRHVGVVSQNPVMFSGSIAEVCPKATLSFLFLLSLTAPLPHDLLFRTLHTAWMNLNSHGTMWQRSEG